MYEIEHLEDLLRDAPYDVVIGGMRTTEIAARYEKQYQRFRDIYPTLKPLFAKLQEQ